jgi:hypothetical protein
MKHSIWEIPSPLISSIIKSTNYESSFKPISSGKGKLIEGLTTIGTSSTTIIESYSQLPLNSRVKYRSAALSVNIFISLCSVRLLSGEPGLL